MCFILSFRILNLCLKLNFFIQLNCIFGDFRGNRLEVDALKKKKQKRKHSVKLKIICSESKDGFESLFRTIEETCKQIKCESVLYWYNSTKKEIIKFYFHVIKVFLLLLLCCYLILVVSFSVSVEKSPLNAWTGFLFVCLCLCFYHKIKTYYIIE